ncbi:MAG: DUF2785 domain-containing protein [Schleiferilactobacillus harbinensis]
MSKGLLRYHLGQKQDNTVVVRILTDGLAGEILVNDAKQHFLTAKQLTRLFKAAEMAVSQEQNMDMTLSDVSGIGSALQLLAACYQHPEYPTTQALGLGKYLQQVFDHMTGAFNSDEVEDMARLFYRAAAERLVPASVMPMLLRLVTEYVDPVLNPYLGDPYQPPVQAIAWQHVLALLDVIFAQAQEYQSTWAYIHEQVTDHLEGDIEFDSKVTL